jgi:hypothetical protein
MQGNVSEEGKGETSLNAQLIAMADWVERRLLNILHRPDCITTLHLAAATIRSPHWGFDGVVGTCACTDP